MDVNRLTLGEKIAAGSAIALFIFMFFSWFGVEVSSGGLVEDVGGEGANAWDALDLIRFVLLLTIIAALAMAFIKANSTRVDLPLPLSAVVAGLGILSVLLILYRIIDPPGEVGGADALGLEVEITREIGVFLGLIAAAGIAYGGFRAMQEEGTSFKDAGDRLRSDGPGDGPGPGSRPGSGSGSATGTDQGTERHPTAGTGTGEPPPPESPRTR